VGCGYDRTLNNSGKSPTITPLLPRQTFIGACDLLKILTELALFMGHGRKRPKGTTCHTEVLKTKYLLLKET
jgi:hypothetical protein